jgi:DNA-3-methyladenine glycosylase
VLPTGAKSKSTPLQTKRGAPNTAAVSIRRLRRAELPHETIALARFLIGKVVVHDLPGGRVSGRIVETEAYPPGDPAGHHYRGPTPRTRSMYLHHGHAYVFFNYGAHFMLNVSSEPPGIGGGILIRALEPLEGIEHMEHHRKTSRLLDLTRGPGRLAAALQIGRRHDGVDLCSGGSLWLGVLGHSTKQPTGHSSERPSGHSPRRPSGRAATEEIAIDTTVRIGITRAADEPLRFYERGNPFVSGPKRLLLAAHQDSADSRMLGASRSSGKKARK